MTDSFDKALDGVQVQSGNPQTVSGTANGRSVTAEVIESGPIGMRVREINVHRIPDSTAVDEAGPCSRQTAQKLVDQITYLEEPLGILEYDAASDTVQIRSTPPDQRNGSPEYYELQVQAESQTLSRFRGSAGPREQIPFDLTKQSLRRLVRDMTNT